MDKMILFGTLLSVILAGIALYCLISGLETLAILSTFVMLFVYSMTTLAEEFTIKNNRTLWQQFREYMSI